MTQPPALNKNTEKIEDDLIKELKEIFGDRIRKDQVDRVKKYIKQRRERKGFESRQTKSDFYTLKDVMIEVSKVVMKKEG